jgi:hypothetical protein
VLMPMSPGSSHEASAMRTTVSLPVKRKGPSIRRQSWELT